MEILNALDLIKGKKSTNNRMLQVTQPLQFIDMSQKDAEWAAWNLDWLEWQGLKQIKTNARRMVKNYKLANGIIDRSDYIAEENNELGDMVEQLTSEGGLEALELKFFPIIPNIVDTLVSEFAKRDKRISFVAVDSDSYNEILQKRRDDLEKNLVKEAERKLLLKLMDAGIDIEDPEVKQKIDEHLQPENLKTLPEIESFYSKSYKLLPEVWATRQLQVDEERFRMEELERTAFRDKLIVDREFWHFNMYEDDYEVELWNPILTFYRKSPNTRYISMGQFVGKMELMTASDLIDSMGWRMNEEQLESLQLRIGGPNSSVYSTGGYQNDGTFYDATKSHKWNVGPPSLPMRQLQSVREDFIISGDDILKQILLETEDGYFGDGDLFRVTTAYWKSQMKIGKLTRVNSQGQVSIEIITEEYKITDKPVYDTQSIKNKGAHNLIFGEHIEWLWINQTWGGVKISPNAPTLLGYNNGSGMDPIYIGINQNQIKPLKFQFKGDLTLWGCKLPVEGRVFSDRNSTSWSLVDSLKPFQIGYNLVNNQIADILIDEIGSVVVLDQNTLPRHSMGEDWGKNNMAKAYVAMKDFSILPLDYTLANTDSPTAFSNLQQLDLSQTNRLISRIQLGEYFKTGAFERVGVSAQRMAQPIGRTTSATEAEQIQLGSYSQTEEHFTQHCDDLMPRVHQMRTDLAQFYHSTKSSIRLQHINTLEERVNFEMNGLDLLIKEFNVYSSSKANIRQLLDKLKFLATNNNTAGASIYDLGEILSADSLGTMKSTMKGIEDKTARKLEEDRIHEMRLQEEKLKAEAEEKRLEREAESLEKAKDRRRDLLVAEIRASGYGAMQDLNQNAQSDFLDNMETVKRTEAYESTANLQAQKINQNNSQHQDKVNLKREEIALKREELRTNLEIARENKNKYDFAPKKEKDKSKKEE